VRADAMLLIGDPSSSSSSSSSSYSNENKEDDDDASLLTLLHNLSSTEKSFLGSALEEANEKQPPAISKFTLKVSLSGYIPSSSSSSSSSSFFFPFKL
jgi:hypothetical protein